jgi:hypothetical protein
VVSLLVGIAIDRELIKSADEPVVKFFPDYSALKSPGWDNITLRHLLTMSSGIQWDENRAWKDPQNDEPHLGSEADPCRYGPFEANRDASGYGVGITMAVERTCSVTSLSVYQANRWRRSRARRCSRPLASPIGNG